MAEAEPARARKKASCLIIIFREFELYLASVANLWMEMPANEHETKRHAHCAAIDASYGTIARFADSLRFGKDRIDLWGQQSFASHVLKWSILFQRYRIWSGTYMPLISINSHVDWIVFPGGEFHHPSSWWYGRHACWETLVWLGPYLGKKFWWKWYIILTQAQLLGFASAPEPSLFKTFNESNSNLLQVNTFINVSW